MPVALRDARVWGLRADLLPTAVRRVRAEDLEAALLQAAAVDRLIKGLGRGDAWDALLQLGLQLMQARPADTGGTGNRGRIPALR
jgi:DNA polymerase-3 subunit delta